MGYQDFDFTFRVMIKDKIYGSIKKKSQYYFHNDYFCLPSNRQWLHFIVHTQMRCQAWQQTETWWSREGPAREPLFKFWPSQREEIWTSGNQRVVVCAWMVTREWFWVCDVHFPLFLNPMLYSFYFRRDGFYYVSKSSFLLKIDQRLVVRSQYKKIDSTHLIKS